MTHQVVDHRHEEVEEQRRATVLHFHLHCARTLECVPASNDECKVVCSQLGVGGRSVGIGVASRGEDGAALHAGLEALFFEGETLEIWQCVAVSGTLYIDVSIRTGVEQDGSTHVDDGILQYRSTIGSVDCALAHAFSRVVDVFEIPTRMSLVVVESRSVVAFIEVLENGREYFGCLIWDLDSFAVRLEELRPTGFGKVGALTKDVFMGGEEPLLRSDCDRDDGGVEVSVARSTHVRTNMRE